MSVSGVQGTRGQVEFVYEDDVADAQPFETLRTVKIWRSAGWMANRPKQSSRLPNRTPTLNRGDRRKNLQQPEQRHWAPQLLSTPAR